MLLDERARTVLSAKEAILAGRSVDQLPVRREIADSWRRSAGFGLDPANCSPPAVRTTETHRQLRRAASLIMTRKSAALAQSTCCVTLTSADGVVLDRWLEDREFRAVLDRMNCAGTGVSIAESAMGTSSFPIALEAERPYSVSGPEHFSEHWTSYTSTSAPIWHPLTRQMIGTMNLSARYEHSSPMLLSWIMDIATLVEQAILDDATGRERLLLESFLSVHRDSRHPVVCLDDGTVIANAAAARLLAPSDQALLWEYASRCIRQNTKSAEVTLADGRSAMLDLRAIFDGERAFAAVVQVRPGLDGKHHETIKRDAVAPPPKLHGLVGRSSAWRQLCVDVGAAGRGSRLIVGGPGVGKMAVCAAAGHGHAPLVLDAAAPEHQGPGGWEAALRRASQIDRGHIVLRHVDLLTKARLRLSGQFATEAGKRGVHVDATATGDRSSDVAAALGDWFDHVIVVPDLSERFEDLPLLLDALTARVAAAQGGNKTLRWLPDAVQALSRIDWSRNVRSLEHLVARVFAERRFPAVGARDLPADVRARAARRALVGLERVEAQAIITALRNADGNKREAAASLGIARSTLYRKVRALGIDLGTWNF
ncbi:Fis family transcriptional regulator [Nocardioides immobilis]|uniref:Fis family transcriptional regulator n=1 Tax=Nocardioides immobilis TaxID=2049295 RepID=A0A417Y6L7_9ACTN|nr:helix-turn-helix domain-containing protein [Nocardioides immobilis]RHW28330.1 Fis family transcriptional regulator [Nocardioides immobilis]